MFGIGSLIGDEVIKGWEWVFQYGRSWLKQFVECLIFVCVRIQFFVWWDVCLWQGICDVEKGLKVDLGGVEEEVFVVMGVYIWSKVSVSKRVFYG